jgi:hypothetical protein
MSGSLAARRARVLGHVDKPGRRRVGPAEDHARMEATLQDGAPVTAGWFVVSARYPVEPAAVRHGAGLASADEVPYARFGEPVRGPAPTDL